MISSCRPDSANQSSAMLMMTSPSWTVYTSVEATGFGFGAGATVGVGSVLGSCLTEGADSEPSAS